MIRIGVIGAGGIANVHLRYLSTVEDVEIAALCDVDASRLELMTSRYGGQAYADFREMLNVEHLDGVYLCTPPEVRREPLLACAESDVAVMCEKPVARSVPDALEVNEQLLARGARVQVGYPFRSMATVRRLADEISDDRIHTVQSSYLCNVSLTMGLPLWFYDHSRSGGGLVDQATHNLDLLRYLVGEVDAVTGFAANPHREKEPGYTIDEVISLSLKFPNGIVGGHVHSWIGHTWQNTIHLGGEKAYYTLLLSRGQLVIVRPNETVTFEQRADTLWDFENAVFLEKLRSGDWTDGPSTYADAIKTLELTLRCNEAIAVERRIQSGDKR